jgi:hypothetical protein
VLVNARPSDSDVHDVPRPAMTASVPDFVTACA